jgi:hypothetical protein
MRDRKMVYEPARPHALSTQFDEGHSRLRFNREETADGGTIFLSLERTSHRGAVTGNRLFRRSLDIGLTWNMFG